MKLYDSNDNAVRNLAAMGGDVLSDSRVAATIAALNAETVIDIAQEHTASIDVRGTLSLTLLAEVSFDGTNYTQFPIWNPVNELFVVSITAAGVFQFDIPSGARKIRVRCSVYTSGSATVVLRASNAQDFVYAKPIPNTVIGTITAASGVAATLTLAAPGAGMFHYINRLIIQRHTSALLTAAATPVIVTTTNLPGSLAFSIQADAATQGAMVQDGFETQNPVKSSVANTATTIVAPVVTGVIWRISAYYYIGA